MSKSVVDVSLNTKFPVITIDGPSGSGKGTVSLMLAQALGYQLLDSGALYRIVGLKAYQAGLIIDGVDVDEIKVTDLTKQLKIEFLPTNHQAVDILVDGEEVGHLIRNEIVGGYASRIAIFPKVREALLYLQQQMAERSGLVADGRDMGTVVFPNADVKVFLTASAEARANRRVAQLKQSGQIADFQDILSNIQDRDKRDKERVTAPLKPAEDALIVDSSLLDANEVFDQIKKHCQQHGICF